MIEMPSLPMYVYDEQRSSGMLPEFNTYLLAYEVLHVKLPLTRAHSCREVT